MNKISKLLLSTLMIGTLVLPSVVLAQGVSRQGFENPLGDDVTGPDIFISRIIDFLLRIVFVLTLLALVVGGIRMVSSFGNEQAVASAKKIILWAIIGMTVVILSWAIIRIVADEILQAG